MMNDGKILLIDARNALYRSVYAHKAESQRSGEAPHSFVFMLRLMNQWISKFKPTSIHIFWDETRSRVWRRKILKTYKARESNPYIQDISVELSELTDICYKFFALMNMRQFYKRNMEADDLIYSAVTVLHPVPSIIISTDSDMAQIPYRFSSCKLYEPKKGYIIETPTQHPVLMKVLQGDKSDHIDGYRGIGPKKAARLVDDPRELIRFLSENDQSIYNRNNLLIDLSLCPKLLNNTLYVRKKIAEQTKFDRETLLAECNELRLKGLLMEFNELIMPFSRLV